jgi:hypothetical protein
MFTCFKTFKIYFTVSKYFKTLVHIVTTRWPATDFYQRSLAEAKEPATLGTKQRYREALHCFKFVARRRRLSVIHDDWPGSQRFSVWISAGDDTVAALRHVTMTYPGGWLPRKSATAPTPRRFQFFSKSYIHARHIFQRIFQLNYWV